jgi:F-type H+-transporting ATPase subunit gamma
LTFIAFFTHASTPEALAAASQTPLDIAISSDRGLCGGIHSSVSKAVKKHVREHPSAKVVVIGQKAKPQIMREARKNIEITFDQVAKAQPNWSEAARITDQILMAKMPITSVNIFFNRFKSVIAFETTIQPVALRAQLTDKLNAYEVSPDVLTNYLEFAFANALYACIAEGNASEQAAKRTAMENATKNAGEMIQKLTLTYNRSRQATITNELIDIITGASAM